VSNSVLRIPNAFYLIIDLEATCSDVGEVPRQEMEIIEIGAVMLDARLFQIEAEFQTFIKPVRHPLLTDFCKELTHINQEDVNGAPVYADAIEELKKWMYEFDDALFCSWGDYDRKQFEQDCAYHGVAYPFRSGHLNLKAAMAQHLVLPKKLGIGDAIRRVGLRFEGTAHRGIDDARNIARIVQQVLGTR